MSSTQPDLYIGLMSGTSMDGIDAALVDFSSEPPKLVRTHSHQWPATVQQALIAARDIPEEKLDTLTELDKQTAEIFADACLELLKTIDVQAQDITAIGSHGQTIRHRPDIDKPYSLQIGNAQQLANLTGIDVISDFRTADIKAGGQGAPLAPAFHQAIFRHNEINRVVVNIGGISNITVLPADKNQPVTGFDCGPGNTLMDAWISFHKQQHFDADGTLCSAGKTNARLLANLLMDEYFQLPAPKSTGFEYFNLKWLGGYLDKNQASELGVSELGVADVQSTLCDLTATSIVRSINQCAPATEEIYICGGGVHNKELMHRLQALTKNTVATTEKLGVHPDWVEAMAFAWLAYKNNHQQTGNLPLVTGAEKAVVLGNKTSVS